MFMSNLRRSLNSRKECCKNKPANFPSICKAGFPGDLTALHILSIGDFDFSGENDDEDKLKQLRPLPLQKPLRRCKRVSIYCPRVRSSMATAKVDLKEFNTLTEGKATILFPKDQVFYNPAQVFNRDLSVATIRTWSENLVTKRQLRKAAWEHKRRKLDNEPDPENIPADT